MMLCPSCNCPLKQETLEGQAVDRCHHCDGICLSAAALGHVVRSISAPALSGTEVKVSPAGLLCPECRTQMILFNYAHDSGVVVSKCRACARVWLGDGQLALLAQYRTGTPAIRALSDALATDMRRAERWRRLRIIIHSRVLSGIVAMAYLLLAWGLADGEAVFRLAQFLALPLFCIWFSAGMSARTGFALGICRPMITERSPADFVAIAAWLLLLSPLVAALLLLL